MRDISEPRPRNIVVFEVLSYLSLAPRAAQVAMAFAGTSLLPAVPLNTGLILIFGVLTFLGARRRKNWARWTLLGFLLLLLLGGLVALFGGGATTSYESLILPFAALFLQFVAMCFAFTPTAAEWLIHEEGTP
jgi:hypothetical protein